MPDYDLYLRADTGGFLWRLADRGVRLGADRIGWTADGRSQEAGFGEICEIHLTRGGGIFTGGDSSLAWMRLIAQRQSPYASVCRLNFYGGGTLKILDADARGLADPARSATYSEFVVRLHEQLAARGSRTIEFASGYTPFRYRMLLFLLSVLGLMEVAALLILLTGSGQVRHGFAVIGGAVWLWFQARMTLQNAPRRYDPAYVPDDLLPAPVTRQPVPLDAPPSQAPLPLYDPVAAAQFRGPAPSRGWLWLLPPAGLVAAIGIGFIIGEHDSPVMFDPGRAQRALAALDARTGEMPIRKLEVTPTTLTLLVESEENHVDANRLMSRLETWTVTHETLFSDWREWDSVSGPHNADALPALEEGFTKPFRLPAKDLPDLARLGQAALEHGQLPDASIRRMSLVDERNLNPIAGQDPLRWTVEIASTRESAEIVFNHDGSFASADLAGTLRVRNLDLLAGGKDFDDTMRAIRTALGDKPIAQIRIEPKEITLRTEDRQYVADLQGVVDRTPQAFFCHAVTDIMTGRFTLERVDWGLLWGVQQRARIAAPSPQPAIAAVVLSAPDPAMSGGADPLQWQVEARSGGKLVRIAFDAKANLVGVRPWGDGHYCD